MMTPGSRNQKSEIRDQKMIPSSHPPTSDLGPRTSARRRGYTIAELLIVMAIMLMLVAITLPAVKNVMQDGAVREASRQLNSYFAMAKARALNTGRPCGVMMICEAALGIPDPVAAGTNIPQWPARQITKMYLAEVPPPYSGSTLATTIGGRGRIMYSLTSGAPPGTIEFHPLISSASGYIVDQGELPILLSLIADGEVFLVRFDYKGAWYVCQRMGPLLVFQQPGTRPFGTTQTGATVPVPPAMGILPNTGTTPYSSTLAGQTYQIVRLPRRIGNPLELTAGTCIDVAYCGIGPTNYPTNTLQYGMYPAAGSSAAGYQGLFPGSPPTNPTLQAISIMFQPDGGIDSVFLNNWFFAPPTTVHLLLGRGDKINLPLSSSANHATGLNMFDPAASNLADPQSLWVSISRSTGAVNTSDNMPPAASAVTAGSVTVTLGNTQQTINPSTPLGQLTYLQYCRQLASNREQAKTQ
jgi:prepilin-type N-terminal cleavage/methylation domain-containing protein